MPKLCIYFEDILSRAHGNFVDRNVLESFVININHYIIINAYYNSIVN